MNNLVIDSSLLDWGFFNEPGHLRVLLYLHFTATGIKNKLDIPNLAKVLKTTKRRVVSILLDLQSSGYISVRKINELSAQLQKERKEQEKEQEKEQKEQDEKERTKEKEEEEKIEKEIEKEIEKKEKKIIIYILNLKNISIISNNFIILNNNNNYNTTTTNKEGNAKKSIKVNHGSNVTLTESEYSKLINDYDLESVEDMIRKMNDWKEKKGAKFTSDYLALRKWLNKDILNITRKKRNVSAGKSDNRESGKGQEALFRNLGITI